MWNRRNVTYFCLLINSLFLFFKMNKVIDEEINVLFIGMVCLRTLEVFDVVKASIRRQVRRGS